MGFLKLKRGTTEKRLQYLPGEGELILDKDTKQLFVGDGVTMGGIPCQPGNANITVVGGYNDTDVAAYLPVHTGNVKGNVGTFNQINANVVGTLFNGNSNVRIDTNANLGVAIGGNANILTVHANGITVLGNVTGNIVGNISGNIVRGNSSAGFTGTNGSFYVTANGTANVFTVQSTGANVTGNFEVTNFATINSLTVQNTANVSGNINATGAIRTNNGNVFATNFDTGNIGSQIYLQIGGSTKLTVTNDVCEIFEPTVIQGNANVNGSANITQSLTVGGVISGNAAGLTNIPAGNITGNVPLANVATFVSLTASNTSTETCFVTFANSQSANSALRTDNRLSYVPSTDTLTANEFNGNARVAGNVQTTTDNTSNVDLNVPFITYSGSTANGYGVYRNADLTFNPLLGTVKTKNIEAGTSIVIPSATHGNITLSVTNSNISSNNSSYNTTIADRYYQPLTTSNASTHTLTFNSPSTLWLTSVTSNVEVSVRSTNTTLGEQAVPVGNSLSVTVGIVQGATAYGVAIGSARFLVGGYQRTVQWKDNSAPTGNANKTNVWTFNVYATAANTYTVTGEMSSYG